MLSYAKTPLTQRKGTMFYKRALRKQKLLLDEIHNIKSQLQTLPEGSFTCQKNGNRYKWRVTIGKKQIYIPKSDQALAEKYAFKTYLTFRLARLVNEETAIQTYLKIHNRFIKTKDEDLLSHPEYQKLLSHYFFNTSENMMHWMNAPFIKNTYFEENLIHDTASGVKMRSKSEQMIEAALRQYNLPYRYEEKLELGETVFYPDYKIMHPKTGEIVIWENIGMSDKPDYMFRLINKLQHYFQYGYYPTVNLILTFDTKECPLTTDRIDRIIEMYFDA